MTKKSLFVGIVTLLLVFSVFLQPFIRPAEVQADHGEVKHPYTAARIYQGYKYIEECSRRAGYPSSTLNEEQMRNGEVFYDRTVESSLGYLFVREAPESAEFAEMTCTGGNAGAVLNAIDVDPFDLFVSTGIFESTSSGWKLNEEMKAGANNSTPTAVIKDFFDSHFSGIDFSANTMSQARQYYSLLAAFYEKCDNGLAPQGSAAGENIPIVDVATGERNDERHLISEYSEYVQTGYGLSEAYRCADLPGALTEYSESAELAVKDAIASGETAPDDPGPQAPGQGQSTQDCQSGSGTLGWILCPIVTGTLSLLEFIANPNEGNGILFDLLQIDVLGASPDSDVSQVTDGFRTLANILLVIAFLFIIFTTSLSVGPEAYTVKKMLPKLIVAGILTQLSLFIGELLIDFFNVLGYGIGSLILAPIGDGALVTISGFFGNSSGSVGGVIGNITDGVVGGVGIIAAGGAALWMLAISLPTIAIAVAAVVLILGLRKIVIVLMIVAMPIAFALYIFPATEKFAKEWFDNLIKLLAMFPFIIALIAGGALLASMSSVSASSSPEGVSFVEGMVSVIALFGPYLLIPFTFKFAGRAFGAVTGGIQNLQSRATGGGRTGAKGGAGGAGWVQKYQNRVRGTQTTVAAGKGRISGSRMGAPLRGLARSGTGVTSKSRRNAQLAYAQSVMSGAKELSEADPEMMQNKDLRRIMQYGSLGKAEKQVDEFRRNDQHEAAAELQKSIDAAGSLAKGRSTTRQQRASLLYASAANGDASVGDMLGSGSLAGSDPKQHEAFLNDIVGKTNKGSGNLGASGGFRVHPNGTVEHNVGGSAQKLAQADPFTMAKDKHWGEGGSTRTAAQHILSGRLVADVDAKQGQFAAHDDYQAARREAENSQAQFKDKLLRAAGNAGAQTQGHILEIAGARPEDIPPPHSDDHEEARGAGGGGGTPLGGDNEGGGPGL